MVGRKSFQSSHFPEVIMRRIAAFALASLLPVGPVAKSFGAGNEDASTFTAKLRGLNEVPPVATGGSGSFSATLSSDASTLTYTLTYNNLSAQILFSHIHFGFPKEATGIMVFLCGPAAGAQGGPPAGTPNPPACPDTNTGTVTGSLTAANVIGPNAQGITPGTDFAKVVQALREGAAYVNVHSARSPSGEIRGQVRAADENED